MRGALLWALSDPYLDLPGALRTTAPCADCLAGRVPPRLPRLFVTSLKRGWHLEANRT